MDAKPTPNQVTRRNFIRCSAAAAFGSILTMTADNAFAAPGAKPNILVYHVDDMGWMDASCYGNKDWKTSNIDRLAESGMRFTQAYAASPICSPTRASIVSGQWPARTRTTGQKGYFKDDQSGRKLRHPAFSVKLPPSAPRLGESMRAAGYRCVHLGKVGVEGENQGFENVRASAGDAAKAALREIKRKSGKPWFIYINDSRPHTPLKPGPAMLKRARKDLKPGSKANPKYAATILEIDRNLGLLRKAVEESNQAKNTIIVFASDNGGFLGNEKCGAITTNAPLRDGKASLYEGGIRIPLIVSWPGMIKPGILCDTPVSSVDYMPTFLDMAKGEKPNRLDGVSLLPLLSGKGDIKERAIYWHWPHYRRSMPGIDASPSSAVRKGHWKLIEFFEDNHVELYNLDADLGEKKELSKANPKKARELKDMLHAWRKETRAQLPKRG